MKSLSLSGLDAQNPLAFFAALGLLRVLDSHALRHDRERPRLSFFTEGRQTPQLRTMLSMDEVIDIVLKDAVEQAGNPALQIAYDHSGEATAPQSLGAIRDLKPQPKLARVTLDVAAGSDRRTSDLMAGFYSELVQAETDKEKTKPTALHFTAGKQLFLKMVDELRVGITAKDVREALVGPWLNTSTLPSLSWDASASRLYALRASDPSREKRGSIAGANWLAVHALAFFPVCSKDGRLVTGCVEGKWQDSVFTWPVWDAAIAVPTVSALLRTSPTSWREEERAAQGITAVFSSRILRSEQGGYGSFCPAEVVLARSAD